MIDEALARRICQRAVEKLIDAEEALDVLRDAEDSPRFRRAFEQCVAAIQSAFWRLEKDLKESIRKTRRGDRGRVDMWLRETKAKVDSDELLKWIQDARHDSTHVGDPTIIFIYHIDYMASVDFPPAPEGAEFYASGNKGPRWVWNYGTAREKWVRAEPLPGTRTAEARNRYSAHPRSGPRVHLGVSLPRIEISRICELAIAWWRRTIDEAVDAFAVSQAPAASTADRPASPGRDRDEL